MSSAAVRAGRVKLRWLHLAVCAAVSLADSPCLLLCRKPEELIRVPEAMQAGIQVIKR